jgi:hypothetical protein
MINTKPAIMMIEPPRKTGPGKYTLGVVAMRIKVVPVVIAAATAAAVLGAVGIVTNFIPFNKSRMKDDLL